jgi:predicted outer membrane repeat protein
MSFTAVLGTGNWLYSSTYYVPDDFPTINAATCSGHHGAIIIVRDGVYTGPGNRDITFCGYALTIKSENGPQNCVIDCQNLGRACDFNSGVTSDAVLEGFTITNCFIEAGNGGAILCTNGSSPTIRDCIITHSHSEYGGAIMFAHCQPIIANCVITKNSARLRGGGIYSYGDATIENCLIAANSADESGGGIHCDTYKPAIINCTIVENTVIGAGVGGGIHCKQQARPEVTNCVVWGNIPDQINLEDYAWPLVTYCDVQEGTSQPWFSTGCIDEDPLFVNGRFHGYYLSHTDTGQVQNSPCIDAGDESAAPAGIHELTTRIDSEDDTAPVDMGYHAIPTIWIHEMSRSVNDIVIYWASKSGVSYTVQWSTDTASWNDVPVGEAYWWTDIGGALESEGYYRVRDDSGEICSNIVGLRKTDLAMDRNLVSIPFVPFNASLDNVIGDQLTGHPVSQWASDQIWAWDAVGQTYILAWCRTGHGWRGWDSMDDPPAFEFEPDKSYWIVISNVPKTLTLLGEVSEAGREIQLLENKNFVVASFPEVVSLDGSALIDSGFTGHPVSQWASDKIEFWDAAAQTYVGVWYRTGQGWRQWDSMDLAPVSPYDEFAPGKGSWITVNNTPFEWIAPKPY